MLKTPDEKVISINFEVGCKSDTTREFEYGMYEIWEATTIVLDSISIGID